MDQLRHELRDPRLLLQMHDHAVLQPARLPYGELLAPKRAAMGAVHAALLLEG